jgi:hypothetical protein
MTFSMWESLLAQRAPRCHARRMGEAGNDRVAVVTGAASGMGLAVAHRLAQQGRPVALLDLDGDAVSRAAADLRAAGGSAVHAGEVDDRGRLAPGLLADVIAVPGDPSEDVTMTQDVRFVMKGGRIYKGAWGIGEPKRMTLPSGSSTAPSCIPHGVSSGGWTSAPAATHRAATTSASSTYR